MITARDIDNKSEEYDNPSDFKDGALWAIYEYSKSDQSQWISVKDRLPENQQSILVFCCHGEYAPENIIISFFENGSFKDTDFDLNSQFSNIDELVSHWQPLPQPPKDK